MRHNKTRLIFKLHRLLASLRGPSYSQRKTFARYFSADSGFGLPHDRVRTATRYAFPRRKRRENINSTQGRTFTIKLNMFTIASCVLP